MIVDIYIGGDKLDLFEDENIEVKSSVADIQDITKNTTDYTKTFTVPASKENNKLFKHWYNATVDNSFDARVKVDGEIRMDGFLFRKGKFRLHKVALKNNAPYSYTINFWGNLLDLKDTLGKDYLSDLDLSAYDHDYDSATIKTGLTDELFSGDVIYNLLTKRQLYYSSDITDTTITDDLTNIGWGDGSGANGVLWNQLNASLKVIRIIEAIEDKYTIANGYQNDIVFSRDFFDRTEFTELYLWLNNTKDISVGGGVQTIDWDGGDTDQINLTTNLGTYDVNTFVHWKISTTITPSAGYETADYSIILYVDGAEFSNTSYSGGTHTSESVLNFTEAPSLPHDYSVRWEVKSNQEFKYTSSVLQKKYIALINTDSYTTTATENTIDSEFTATNEMPKIKTIDFLKGLFKMFKLVVIPQEDGTLYINTLNAFYDEGVVHDFSNYIDYNSHSVSRGKILNEIDFVFDDPQTILNMQFEKNTRIAYGDAETKLTDEFGKVLDGTKLEYKLPFEQILYERLTDQNDSALSNIQYGAIIDEDLEPVNPKPHLFYNIKQSIGTKTVGFINDVAVKEELSGNINTPSHTIGFDTSNFSTIFDAEFSTWNGALINNTLYKNYHERYILSIFNVKKREYTYTAKNVPLRIMLDLKLNDLIKIKEQYFRINNFTTNLKTGDIKLNLINSFDDIIVDNVVMTPTNFFIDNRLQTVSSYGTNLDTYTATKNDTGFGDTWVTITTDGKNMFFAVDENLSGLERDMTIDLTIKGKQDNQIYINQKG